jgi:hypothetical protein
MRVPLKVGRPRDARPDSDVDLCIVAEGAARQLEAAQQFSRAMRPIRPKPSFTLVPITPERLLEKRNIQDHFFLTVLNEGVRLATENLLQEPWRLAVDGVIRSGHSSDGR